MGRFMDLSEAKSVTGNDKIFYNGDDKFNLLDTGKYASGFTIIIPREWELDEKGQPICPFYFRDESIYTRYTDNMNFDFDASTEVLFGKYHLSQKGRPVFEITPPTQAEDVMISAGWGGAFSSSRGRYKDDPEISEDENIKYFTRRSSNGGGAGRDYYVLPVGYVQNNPNRDVSDILKEIENHENKINEERKQAYQDKLKTENDMKDFHETFVKELSPLIEEYKSLYPNTAFIEEEFYLCVKGNYIAQFKYNQNELDWAKKRLNEDIKLYHSKEKITPQIKELATPELLSSLEGEITYGEHSVTLKFRAYLPEASQGSYEQKVKFFSKELTVNYDNPDIMTKITQIINDRIDQDKEVKLYRKTQEIQLQEKIKYETEVKAAKEKGYPSDYTAPNRLGGATRLCHTYVISQDGTIRPVDDNILRNLNHMYKYSDPIEKADGQQIYRQIMPGDIVISFSKDYTAAPLVLSTEWTPGRIEYYEVTPEQKDVLANIYNELVGMYSPDSVEYNNSEGIERHSITNAEEFVEKVISQNEKSLEDKMPPLGSDLHTVLNAAKRIASKNKHGNHNYSNEEFDEGTM